MPDAVLFDLDETLLDRTASLRAFLHDQFGRFRPKLGTVRQDEWKARFLELDARGSVHKSRVYPALLDIFGGDPGAAEPLYDDYAANCWRYARPSAGMASVLGTLRRRDKRLGVVTNGESAFQRRHCTALGLDRLVDTVIVSEEEDLRKPDPGLFHLAASRLGVQPTQCLFVGDDPTADVLGASAAGMTTLWFRGGRTWPRELPGNPGPGFDTLDEVLGFAS